MKTAFRDVKDRVRRRIVGGHWPPGALLPNEVDLAAEFQCARTTVNRAMRELAEEGLVERKRKAGTRVLPSPTRQARFAIPIVREEIESRGLRYRYALVQREIIDTPDWLRARIGLDQGGRLVHLTCMHFGDGHPYQLEDRWINLAALPQAAEADFTRRGPNEWLIAEVPYSDAEISFSAMAADAGIARHMGCGEGDALFLAERSTWWQGQPITYVRLVFQRGFRMTTRY
ncbi:GntR family transcriptional regulator [Shimia sp.]|uniref:GntR family transcriptional regulator n=1 Tax=Shimia sp. TaxID=1954381 RepID=UPI003567E90E